MVRLLNNRQYFSWRNYSVPTKKAFGPLASARMKEELRQQIRPVHCVIIIAGMWTSYSDWIQFEIDFSRGIEKPILGVRPWGAQRMPLAVSQASNLVVNWNTDSIVEGIRKIS